MFILSKFPVISNCFKEAIRSLSSGVVTTSFQTPLPILHYATDLRSRSLTRIPRARYVSLRPQKFKEVPSLIQGNLVENYSKFCPNLNDPSCSPQGRPFSTMSRRVTYKIRPKTRKYSKYQDYCDQLFCKKKPPPQDKPPLDQIDDTRKPFIPKPKPIKENELKVLRTCTKPALKAKPKANVTGAAVTIKEFAVQANSRMHDKPGKARPPFTGIEPRGNIYTSETKKEKPESVTITELCQNTVPCFKPEPCKPCKKPDPCSCCVPDPCKEQPKPCPCDTCVKKPIDPCCLPAPPKPMPGSCDPCASLIKVTCPPDPYRTPKPCCLKPRPACPCPPPCCPPPYCPDKCPPPFPPLCPPPCPSCCPKNECNSKNPCPPPPCPDGKCQSPFPQPSPFPQEANSCEIPCNNKNK